MKNRTEIYDKLVSILSEEFDIEPSLIKMDTLLYEELDLDSIDTVDLVLILQDLTGSKIEPDTFKTVRTVEDVVNAVEKLII